VPDPATGVQVTPEGTSRAASAAPADPGGARGAAPPSPKDDNREVRPARFAAVNLISDPIHGYLELTKRLAPTEARAAGFEPEESAEEDLLDSTWLQRLRRISQLQSARWVFPTAEHSRFTHGLGVMHEAGLWGRQLYPSLADTLRATNPGLRPPSEGLVVETLRVAGLLHDVGHGPFAHFFDEHVLARFPAPADPRREGPKPLRRAPGGDPHRDGFAPGEAIDPAWVAYLVAKPPLDDPAMPGWVRWLQPLLSGPFTVDNLDYVRRDAYLCGVSSGPVDAERLRRYSFIGEEGLTLLEPGLGALEMFLTARLFMYQQVYFHRTVRAIDLDLAEVFAPSIRAIFGERSPAEDLRAYADLDEYALLHQAARWSRGEDVALMTAPGDGRVTPAVAGLWRRILLRRPRWRAEAEIRVTFEPGEWPVDAIAELGAAEPGRVAIDLAVVDARPSGPAAGGGPVVAGRDGRPGPPLAAWLDRLPAFALIGRRYRRFDGGGP
jgi:hypothetical protein